MEITRKKLKSIIFESEEEIDEMGRIVDKTNSKGRVIRQAEVVDSKGERIGFKLAMDPYDLNNPENHTVTIIFGCTDKEKWFEENPGEEEFLISRYGPNIGFTNAACPTGKPTSLRVHDAAYRKDWKFMKTPTEEWPIKKTPYQGPEKGKKNQEIIKRSFYPILRKELGTKILATGEPNATGEEFEKIMTERSLPSIFIANDEESKKHADHYESSFTDEKIYYRSNSQEKYKSAEDFLQKIVNRIAGEPTERDIDYIAMQYNKKYKTWSATKKSEQNYEGKTDVYGLDKRGYEEVNIDIIVYSVFEIEGIQNGGRFTWTIKYKPFFGSKRPDDYAIRDGLKMVELNDNTYLDSNSSAITASITTELTERIPGSKGYQSIMQDPAVFKAFRQTIYDFKQKIESIDPTSLLQYASLNRSDIEKLDEQKINKIIKNIISELKFKK
jgi:hypothetical protein